MAKKNSSKKDQAPSNLGKPPEDVTIPYIVTGRPPLNIEWCWVPAGPFTMGSGSSLGTKPIHTVNLAGFWLACHLVTNVQYRHFVVAGGYETSRWWSVAGWKWRQERSINQPGIWTDNDRLGDKRPVVAVSWYEATAFARWAAETTNEPIRLPTEAQWERGAKGLDGRTNPWDMSKIMPMGEFGMYCPAGDGPHGNAYFGGNVEEWTSSLNYPYPYDAGDGREDQAAKGFRVVRGSPFSVHLWFGRASWRRPWPPDFRLKSTGFRLAAAVVTR